MANDDDDGFLARWSRRKVQTRRSAEPAVEPTPQPQPPPLPPAGMAVAPVTPPALVEQPAVATAPPAPEPPKAPTMEDVQLLTRSSDYSRFVARGVDVAVQRAAMKKLFSDPRFNVMDGLDVYIEDYGVTTPISPSELRQMTQSKFLRLFEDEEKPEQPGQVSPDGAAQPEMPQSELAPQDTACADAGEESAVTDDEDPDLQLQPDDAAGRPGAEPRARRDGG
jgi:hypothetical protein